MGHRDVECALLTSHGTFVCLADNSDVLSHKPLTEPGVVAGASRLTVKSVIGPELSLLLPFAEDVLHYESNCLQVQCGTLNRSAYGRGYHLKRGNVFLCASGLDSTVTWDRQHAGAWETFLPVSMELVAQLARLPKNEWENVATGQPVFERDIFISRNFVLYFGPHSLDLGRTFPLLHELASVQDGKEVQRVLSIPDGDTVALYTPVNASEGPRTTRIWLKDIQDSDWHRWRHLNLRDDTSDRAVLLTEESTYYPPTFASRKDRDFFLNKCSTGTRPKLGYSTSEIRIKRIENAYMFLARGLEGVIFDSRGVYRNYGLGHCSNLPPGLVRENDSHFLDVSALNSAPTIKGEYAVFFNANLQNYFHWLGEGILSLFLLKKALPADAKIVLPAEIENISNIPYLECLKLLGFNQFEILLTDNPIVRLERAAWVDLGQFPDDYPANALKEFQSIAATIASPESADLRIYVERGSLRGVENGIAVKQFLQGVGFIVVRLEELSALDQIRLFAAAEFVVAPHGAGLTNLVFSPPRTRVIEFMPDAEMRPFFWLLSSKLGHEYGMLRCPTHDGQFNGRLSVDTNKLERLFALLERA